MFALWERTLLDETLELDRISSIRIGLAQVGNRLLDGLAVLACPFRFRLGLDHPLFKHRDDQGKLLFSLGLPAKNPPYLLCLAAPLTMAVKNRRREHLLHLFVGVGIRARTKRIKLIPQGR